MQVERKEIMSYFTERYSRRVPGDYPAKSRNNNSFIVQQGMQPVFFSEPISEYETKPQPLLSLFGKLRKKIKSA